MQKYQDLLVNAYATFNDRDIDAFLAVMQPNVAWANGMEGGYGYSYEARQYWNHQWNSID